MATLPEAFSPGQRLSSISSLSEERALSVKRYGLLSQTVSPGTQIRWILPARIRSRKHNDVIFVGTTSIQLRECQSDGTLLDATAKLHIGTQILMAKVVSAKIEKVPTIDAVLRQEWDEEQFLIKGKPCTDQQPPQILLLCTNAGELVYIYAVRTKSTGVRFVYAKRSIIQGMSMLSKWGRHMAIDPESKLLAVATSDVLSVFSLRDVDDIKAAIDASVPRQPTSFSPNKEQRFLPIDGVILRMDFIRSPDDERDKTFLLLIVAKAGQSKILLYRWDSQGPLIFMEPLKCSGRILPVEDSFPLMLIPSSRPLSFWMVTELELVFYENILSNTAKRIATPLNAGLETKSSLLWARWAKPVRHDQYEKDKEEILLIREDGMTRYFTRTHNPSSAAIIAVVPGMLKICVDTAVCMLPGPRIRGGDILILGGVGTDGGVFWLPPREVPQILQPVPNLSHLYDMLSLQDQKHNRSRRQIFSISGNLQSTSVNELRSGFEAQSLATVPIDDFTAFDRIWALEQEQCCQLLIIASNLERTVVISQSLANADDMQLLEDQDHCALMISEETLAVGKLSSGIVVQVTSSGIYATSDPIVGRSVCQIHQMERCVGADINTISGLFAAACVTSSDSYIEVGMIQQSSKGPNLVMSAKTLNTPRPFSMRLTQIADLHILILGFFDGSVHVYTIDGEGNFQLCSSVEGSENRGIGVSAVDILHQPGHRNAIVLTGSLDGFLTLSKLCLYDSEPQRSFSIDPCACYRMGLSRVHITRDQNDEGINGAFISSDERLAKVSLLGGEGFTSFLFDEIWVTDRANTSMPQPLIRAISRIPRLKSNPESEWSNNVLFAAPEQILSTNLIEQRQTIPLRYAHCGQARHLAYSAFFDKLVVASDSTLGADDRPRYQPALYLINPNLSDGHESQVICIRFGEENEKVKALLNWSPSDGRTHYNLVVVALSNGRDSRIGHLSAKKLSDTTNGTANFKNMMTLPRTEVHAICEIGGSSLVIAAGNQLILLHLEVEAKKWSQQARYEFPSAAFSLSVRGSHVYAATKSHSMLVLKLEGQQFSTVFTDKSAQNVRHVLPFGNDGKHVLVSALNGVGTIVYGYMQGTSSSDNPSPSFEAQIPLPVDHIIPIKTNWIHDEQYGFCASTMDGTLYHLKTLTFDEYKLLHFLEKIARSDISKPARKNVALLTKKLAQTWINGLESEGTSTFDPQSMHVNGDVIERLVEERSPDLRDLLGPVVKLEDPMAVDDSNDQAKSRWARFDLLATRVVGQNVDQVGAVNAWARRLLRSSIV